MLIFSLWVVQVVGNMGTRSVSTNISVICLFEENGGCRVGRILNHTWGKGYYGLECL